LCNNDPISLWLSDESKDFLKIWSSSITTIRAVILFLPEELALSQQTHWLSFPSRSISETKRGRFCYGEPGTTQLFPFSLFERSTCFAEMFLLLLLAFPFLSLLYFSDQMTVPFLGERGEIDSTREVPLSSLGVSESRII
jgi:hypothetical protein